MRCYLRLISFGLLCAWTSTTAQTQAQPEFGKLRAEVNGKTFIGQFGPNSIIAVWDTSVGQMQIQGDRRAPGHRTESLRVTMRCGGIPKPGTYAIRNAFSPVSSDAFIEPSGWARVWPLRGTRTRAFVSDSMPPGMLVLERVDSIIKGHFEVSLRTFNRTPADTLHVRATFFGRLAIHPQFPRPREHWAPMFKTDCERIRNAVSM